MIKHDAVTVRLIGEDGNAFAIIGKVTAALDERVSPAAAAEYREAAFACPSYDALLNLTMSTVHVV